VLGYREPRRLTLGESLLVHLSDLGDVVINATPHVVATNLPLATTNG
jgi:hypothetical protein